MVLLTSPGYYSHHYTMNVRRMEYVRNNMNMALVIEIYIQTLTTKKVPSISKKVIKTSWFY